MRKLWTRILAGISALPAVWQFIKWLLGWGEHIEFIAHRVHDINYVGPLLEFLLNPPPWFGVALIVPAFVLLWLASRQRPKARKAEEPKGDSLLVDSRTRDLAGIVHAILERAGSYNFKFPLPPADPYLQQHDELKFSTHPIWTNNQINQLRRDFMQYSYIIGARDEVGYTLAELQGYRERLRAFGNELIAALKGETFVGENDSPADKETVTTSRTPQPRCTLSIVRTFGKDDYWWLEINNRGVDAEYVVMLDFAKTEMLKKPIGPVHAEWQGGSEEKSRTILDGSKDLAFIHGIEKSSGGIIFTDEFRWVSSHGRHTGHGVYSWALLSDPKTFPPAHNLKIIVSAKPPLAGGSKVLILEIKGDKLRVVSGDCTLDDR
jgi:hypothetical protein